MTVTIPSPTALAAKRTALVATLPIHVPQIHDGVVKTKHLQPGQEVRPFVHGEPRGALRTVESVERIDDGEQFFVTFSSLHPDLPYAAAYRWHCEALEGSLISHKLV